VVLSTSATSLWLWLCKERGDRRKMKLELVQDFDGALTFVLRGKNHNTVVN
jgi:hypothetical protein